MKYHIHFGKLYPIHKNETGDCLCYVKWPYYTQNKQVCSSDGAEEIFVQIEEADNGILLPGHKYVLTGTNHKILAEGQPEYAEGADLHPLSHAPRADRVSIDLPDGGFLLKMLNSQNFTLTAPDGHTAMELIHNGSGGGWNISADDTFDAMLIMGIFLFSRYLDKENEFVVV